MNAGVPSRTALGVAYRRAAHQVFDDPVVFRDPLAGRIVAGLETVRPFRTPHSNSLSSRSLRAFIAARSRYAEDQLASFFTRGVRQYVVLGAGLDTFAYRNPYAPELKVFEVDHPTTQAWKMERLHAAGIAVPDSLGFVPIDFERQRLAQVLQTTAGFDTARSSFFSLLGVTPYLSRDALGATLTTVASLASGGSVVLDYAIPADSLSLRERTGLTALSARVAKIGEPFRLFLKPEEFSKLLRDLNFDSIEDLGQEEINSRYFQHRSDGLRIGSAVGRLLRATVAAR
jgi:methyltransferase (TIGR00027 family)